MSKYSKHVFKQDLNFLDFPLWFQVSHAADKMEWRDSRGYLYRAAYRAPDQLDMLFLLYLLMRAQQDQYPAKMVFSRYEILKGCGCPINPQYLRRLEDSLKRWLNVTLEFDNSFFDGKDYISVGFHILEHYRIREKDKRLEISFSNDFLEQTRQSSYFKYLDFNYYRILRRPVSRRLFEILTRTFKGSNQWKVPLVELGQKLTLYSRKRRKPNGEEEQVIYPSDVLTAVRSAVSEINKLATDARLLRELGMDPKEIYAVTYEVDRKRKTIEFSRAPLSHLFDALIQEPDVSRKVPSYEEPRLEELVSFLKRSSRPLRELITKYYRSHGYEFVKWNVFYANRNGARNYVSYLKLCLQHNWAQEFREEYERMFEATDQKIDERKLGALIRVAKQADHLRMADGQKFKIKRVFPNGAIEISNRHYKMDFILSPAQAYNCRFEREDPQASRPRLGPGPENG
ncbi:MAG: replication initiator protein A [Candidatus Sericytochromatia bacterium]